MRLWSLHPSALDSKGLVALWREGLLAQKVLLGQTKGYRFHPQLDRFRESGNPVAAIGTYLRAVLGEARVRGYNFDSAKIAIQKPSVSMTVSRGQLDFERKHLLQKLRTRDPVRFRALSVVEITPHPMMRVVEGDLEPWEVVR